MCDCMTIYVSMHAFAYVHSVVTLGQKQSKGRANNRTYSIALVMRKIKIKYFHIFPWGYVKVKKFDNI